VDVDRARSVATGVDVSADVGQVSLPYADVDVCWPGSANSPRQLESATSPGVLVHPVSVARPTSGDVASASAYAPLAGVAQRTSVDVMPTHV